MDPSDDFVDAAVRSADDAMFLAGRDRPAAIFTDGRVRIVDVDPVGVGDQRLGDVMKERRQGATEPADLFGAGHARASRRRRAFVIVAMN